MGLNNLNSKGDYVTFCRDAKNNLLTFVFMSSPNRQTQEVIIFHDEIFHETYRRTLQIQLLLSFHLTNYFNIFAINS